MKKLNVTLALTLIASAILLSACSKNDEVVATAGNSKGEMIETTAALQKAGEGLEGSWSFCHDKTLTTENVVENCNLYDTFLWQFENENITVGKVTSPLITQNCTTQCYSAQLSSVQVNNLANGYYSEEGDAIIIDITNSKDLVSFPTCQVKWNIIDKVDDQHQQWQLENINCTTPIFDFKTWVKKVN